MWCRFSYGRSGRLAVSRQAMAADEASPRSPPGPDGRSPFYGCMTRHPRGGAICRNALEVRLADAEDAQAPAGREDLSGELPEELARIDAEVTHSRKRSRLAATSLPSWRPCRSASVGAHTCGPSWRASSVRQRLMSRPWGQSCSVRDHCLTGEHNEA